MEALHMGFWAVVVLGVLIFVHELGHFLMARWLGVKVEIFSLGFGPRLFTYRGRETEYVLSAIPLGGYVKMLGEQPGGGGEGEEPAVAVAPEDLPRAFFGRPVRDRFLIVFAGPAFNFIFAVVFLTIAYLLGVQEQLPVVGKVTPDLPAEQAGLQPGDEVINITGSPITRWEELSRTIAASGGRTLLLTVRRGDGKTLEISVKPVLREAKNIFGETISTPVIGIVAANATRFVRYGFVDSLEKGAVQTWRMLELTFTSIWKLIAQEISADQIGGPLLIAELAGKTASEGRTDLLFFMALVSVNLGLLNLLPVPVLDGGHLFFYLIEGIRGAPLSPNVQWMAQRVGIAFLAGLMLLAMYNDVVRLMASK